MHKWIMSALMVIAGVMAVVFTFQIALEASEDGEPADENTIVVLGENWNFDKETYTVEAGVPITITYRNKPGGGLHSMAIEGTDIHLNDGESVKYTFEPGTYKIYCNLLCGEGHATMVSELVVEEPAESPAEGGQDQAE